MLRLIPAGAVAAALQLALWRRVAGFSHPNLLPLLDSGHDECNGEPVLYAVFECPDETLQTALDQGPLTESDALEILRAVLAALNYLHSQDLVHTAVDARHIVAVGNQIKLWSDTVHPPARSEGPAEDVASLGDLLFHVLTGHTLGASQSPNLAPIPDPFRRIIENTSAKPPQRRWTLAQIAQTVDPQPLAPQRPTSPRKPPPSRRALPLWTYGALAAMLAGLGFLFLPKSVPPPVSPAPPPPSYSTRAAIKASSPTVPESPVPAPSVLLPPSAETAPLSAEPSTPEVGRAISPPEPAPSSGPTPRPREVWRVVTFTYPRYTDAQRKVKSINQRWPAAKAVVFSPNGSNRPPHLVALGGLMTRDQAVRFLKVVRGKGLPRNSYIQNYAR